jgi:outer membrane lipoprotein-sorting protein
MKHLTGLLAIFLFAASGLLNAQDDKAKAILDELSNKTRKYNTITSEFTFTLDDKMADVHQEQKGVLKMKGDKYFIRLGENLIYSDGETRWTYNEEMNEVYIDYADTGEESLNPTDIFTIWETGFNHYYKGTETMNGKTYEVIKLVPTEPKDKTYHTINVYVDKSKMEVGRIEILGKQGDNYTYAVSSFKTDVNYSDDTFIFDAGDYPGVDAIDNR